MEKWIDTLLVLLLLINLYTLGTSRLFAFIKIMAFQGVLLACLPYLLHPHEIVYTLLLGSAVLLIKGILIPLFIMRAIRRVKIRREIEPFIGFTSSLFLGMVIIILSFWMARRLKFPFPVASNLLIPVAIATLFTGMLILVSRKKAITQVLGYVLFESGIYIFALALAESMPVLVEMGVLLDLFVGVFIMGITLLHIKDVFDDLDVSRFIILRD